MPRIMGESKGLEVSALSAFAEPSVVMLEQIRTIDKSRIERYLGRATQSEMTGIDKALLTSVALQYLCGNLSVITDALPTNP